MEQESAISRRTALKKISFLACAVPVSIAAASSFSEAQAAAKAKMSKAEAKYQDQPKGDQKCDGCNRFIPPKGCKRVEGDINPQGWCQLWRAKK